MAEHITTKEEFLEKVAGRKLVRDRSWVIISPSGTVAGEGPEIGVISGDWVWSDGCYCRDIVIGGVPLPHDCQRVSLDKHTVTFTHQKGDGMSIGWTIE